MANTSRTMRLLWSLNGRVDRSLIKSAQDVAKNLDKIKKAGSDLSNNLGPLTSKLGSLTKYLSIGSLIGGATSMIALAKTTANAGDRLDELSGQLGLSAQALSRWQHAANMSGLSNEDFAASTLKLNKMMGDAAQGSKTAILAFRRAGVNIRDSSGKLKTADQVMLEMSDTFAKMPEGIYKSDLAMTLFGKSGGKMVPLLQDGSNAIKGFLNQADELGLTFSNEQAKAAAEFNDNLDLMKKSVQGTAFSIGNQLIPIISPLIQSTTKWIVANRQLISSKVAEWVAKFRESLPQIKQFVLNAYSAVKSFTVGIYNLGETLGGWMPILKWVIGTFVALKGIQLATWIYSVSKSAIVLGTAIKGLIPVFVKFAAVLMANPIGLIIAGIAALITAGVLLYKNWDKVKAFFIGLWDAIEPSVMPIINFFAEPLKALGKSIADHWHATVKLFSGLWDTVKAGIQPLIDAWDFFFGDNEEKTATINVKTNMSDMGALAGSIANNIPQHGNGGLITKPEIAQIGEDGPEMVIPLSKPSRGTQLLQNAAKIMGMDLSRNSGYQSGQMAETMANSVVSNQSNSTFSPSFNPTITVTGSSNPEETKRLIAKALNEQQSSFKKMIDEYRYQNTRIGVF